MKQFLCAVFCGVLITHAAAADPQPAQSGALLKAYTQWADEQGIKNRSFVAMYHGAPVGPQLYPDKPVELASLSKAVTAVCAASLIQEGRWSAQTTSAEILGFGHAGITVGQLLTHTSGLSPDSTQETMPQWVADPTPRKREVAEHALNRPHGGQSGFGYNNENYAILGEMIEVALGVPYAQTCAARALRPAGVGTTAPSDLAVGMLPWGGWRMSARDYAKFQYHWFGPSGVYGDGAPDGLRRDVQEGAEYGLGMFERQLTDHRNFWHFGLWCMPRALNAGAFAVILKGEWSVVATYDKCVDWDAMFALDAALVKQVYTK
ncbi:MAG: serine hydrolase domain-containing protein [Sulfitobacter sp.]